MHFLYIDESGDLGAMPSTPLSTGNDQPVLVICGLLLSASRLEPVTQDFLHLKDQFFPKLSYRSNYHLDRILSEIKGATLRKNLLRGSKKNKRHAIGFLDKLFDILEKNRVKIITRIWVKKPGDPFNGKSVYTSTIQWMYQTFDEYLQNKKDLGVVIADSRDFGKNVNVSHSIFTKKFSSASPAFRRVLELPLYGHSDNHALIQISDILSSALIFPMASYYFCHPHVANIHVNSNSSQLKNRFGQRLKNIQFRYQDQFSNWRGGITVSDPINQKTAKEIF